MLYGGTHDTLAVRRIDMKNVYSDVIQFRGTHYEFGWMQGERLRNSLILQNRKKQWGNRPHQFIINQDEYRHVIMQFAPSIWEEIRGLADALNIEMEEAIREFGGFYLEYTRSGCSIFTTQKYMIRNYDNHPHSYEGRYVLFQPRDTGYATIGPSMQITGRTDGLNEKGLVMGYNFINRRGSRDGFLCNMIGRLVLETCANVEEAISLLKEIPHRMSFSYVLLDQSGRSVVVEASPRRVVAREGNICTNHFEKLTDENRYRLDESTQRERAIELGKQKITNFSDAFRLMNDSTKGVFSSKYGAWAGTLHTASYHPKQLLAGYALGGDRQPMMIDFKKWLNGERLLITKLRGRLNTEAAFVNMEPLSS